jgi:hypothetical protein
MPIKNSPAGIKTIVIPSVERILVDPMPRVDVGAGMDVAVDIG